jgi:acyl-CoA synthetase (AMP-forming)/AMP-acid ligase II
VLFTSGTTGAPKGVVLEHAQVCAVYRTLAGIFGMEQGDRQLVVLPFFHSFGLHVGILASLMVGATILPHLVFDPDVVMRRIAADRVTSFPGPPSVFQAMLSSPLTADLDLSSLKKVTIGAAGFPPRLVEDLRDRLGIERIQSGCGLTESSGTVALCSPPDTPEMLANTVGRPIPGVELRIVDDDGRALPDGQSGEVLVRGYTVMRGYLDDPEQTAAAIDPEGWLHTGDVGFVRDDGNLVITDRKKDMYTVGGFNAYPAEIERILAQHPQIGQVAVIGVPDERLGEVGMAFVIPRPGAQPEPAEVVAWAREQMANYKAPRHVEIVTELPLNATGKVVKGVLREQARQLLAQ